MDQELKIDPIYVDLHKRVMKQIEEEPERWDQRAWAWNWNLRDIGSMGPELFMMNDRDRQALDAASCNTTFCYAGWALALSGYTLRNGSGIAEAPNGDSVTVMGAAKDLLGLTYEQASRIFDTGATSGLGWEAHPEKFKEMVSEVTGIQFD